MSDDKAAARSHRGLLSHPLWRRAFADRLYLALVVCLVVAQGATSAVDWYGFTYQGWREANPTWAALLSASPLLSASVRFLAAIILLPPALLFLRTVLPGRWPYLALWCALAISVAALVWDSHLLFA